MENLYQPRLSPFNTKQTWIKNYVREPRTGILNWGPRPPLGDTEWFSGSHEQGPLLYSSAMILQNPIDEQGATSVDSFGKGATSHERLRTTDLEDPVW